MHKGNLFLFIMNAINLVIHKYYHFFNLNRTLKSSKISPLILKAPGFISFWRSLNILPNVSTQVLWVFGFSNDREFKTVHICFQRALRNCKRLQSLSGSDFWRESGLSPREPLRLATPLVNGANHNHFIARVRVTSSRRALLVVYH